MKTRDVIVVVLLILIGKKEFFKASSGVVKMIKIMVRFGKYLQIYGVLWQSTACVCVCCKKYVSLCFFPLRSTPFPFFVNQHESRGPPRTSSSPSSSEINVVMFSSSSSSLCLSLFLSFTSRAKLPDLRDIGRLYAKRRKEYRREQNAYPLLH